MPESVINNYADPKAAADLFIRTQRLDSYISRFYVGTLVSSSDIGSASISSQITHTRTPTQAHELFEGIFKNSFENTGEDVPAAMILIPLKNVDETKYYVIERYSCELTDGSKGKCTYLAVYFRNNNIVGRVGFTSTAGYQDLVKITEWAQKAADRMGR
jgi:hypothetical protein